MGVVGIVGGEGVCVGGWRIRGTWGVDKQKVIWVGEWSEGGLKDERERLIRAAVANDGLARVLTSNPKRFAAWAFSADS